MKSFLLVATPAILLAHEFGLCKQQLVDTLGVQSVLFSPEPPQIGPLTVTMKGVPTSDIVEGQLHVDVRVWGVTVQSQVLDLCSVVSCPLQAGLAYEASVTQEIPAGTPSHVAATVRLSLVTKEKKTLSCLESFVELGGKQGGVLSVAENELKFLFDKWAAQHPKMVANFKVFRDNMKKIISHNSNPEKSFTMAMNEFGSMTEEEFVRTRMGFRQQPSKGTPLDQIVHLRNSVAQADPPSELDWSAKGVVTPVKNQGACGSCWAFSAVGSLESSYALKTGNLVEFSEQELVSCDNGDYGCQGGLMDNAFDWIEHYSSGLCSEADYPYTSGTTSARGECLKDSCVPIPDSVPKGYVDIKPDEASLLAAVASHGPVSVAIEADQAAFQFYHSGVLTGACGTNLDHGVLLVGYGVDSASGLKYWKVKNSWGAGWGEAGYVRIQRGKRWPMGGQCGINQKASYPVF